jgi:hypothetical protein
MAREIRSEYADPLGEIWLAAARKLGFRIARAPAAYASWDGNGTLTLAPEDEFDPDDTLAQMILHEICHSLVAGPDGMRQVDWGLDNTSDRDVVQEHATNRLQAAWTEPYGLREFLAVTTDFRAYYDALPRRPLADGMDPAIAPARTAKIRAEREPYATTVADALEATARLAAVVRPFSSEGSLWRRARLRHPSGLLMPKDDEAQGSCGGCAWSFEDGDGLRCRQTSSGDFQGAAVAAAEVACERYESAFDEAECGRCGACCREGFDLVPVDSDDALLTRHPELVSTTSLGPVLPRPGGRCVALTGGGTTEAYRCRIYDDRPRSCRDFEVRGEACLLARKRVGLSP